MKKDATKKDTMKKVATKKGATKKDTTKLVKNCPIQEIKLVWVQICL